MRDELCIYAYVRVTVFLDGCRSEIDRRLSPIRRWALGRDTGQGTIEWALIVALISLAAIVLFFLIREGVSELYADVLDAFGLESGDGGSDREPPGRRRRRRRGWD